MKTIIYSLLAILSANAMAMDLAEKHESMCSRSEAKTEMGDTGSCRIVVALAPVEDSIGTCVGKIFSTIPCQIDYSSSENGANLRVKCGTSAEAPLQVPAESLAYTVSAVVTKQDNSETVITDSTNYSYFESSIVSLVLSKTELSAAASITLNLKSGPIELTDVVCQ